MDLDQQASRRHHLHQADKPARLNHSSHNELHICCGVCAEFGSTVDARKLAATVIRFDFPDGR
jgi:hypothetical protein